MTLLILLVGALLGAGAGWLFSRRGRAPGVAPGVSPHLLPDPALEWLRRAHGATGVWVAEMDSREGEPHAERVVDAERLSVAQIVAVDRRLERARDQEQAQGSPPAPGRARRRPNPRSPPDEYRRQPSRPPGRGSR